MHLTDLLPASKHNFYMLDIETAGLSPCRNYITSLCLVQFNGYDGNIIDKLHFRFAEIPKGKIGNEETIKWRKDNGVNEMENRIRPLSITKGLDEVREMLDTYNEDKSSIIFANHTEFDIGYLQEYYDQQGLKRPWGYNNIYDLGSVLLGCCVTDKSSFYVNVLNSQRWRNILSLHFEGKEQKHNAFYDCVLQVEVLMAAFKNT